MTQIFKSKTLAIILILSLILTYALPISAFGAENNQGWQSGVQDGGETELSNSGLVISKTALPTDTPNQYEITLTVKTHYKLEDIKTNKDTQIVLVIDCSGSMCSNNPIHIGKEKGTCQPGCRLYEAKTAAKSFVDSFLGGEYQGNRQIAVVGFGGNDWNNGDGFEVSKMTNNAEDLKTAIDGILIGNGDSNNLQTNIGAGLDIAAGMFSQNNTTNKYAVLLSDGEPNKPLGINDPLTKPYDEATAKANNLKNNGVSIFTLGCGEIKHEGILGNPINLLKYNIASDPGNYSLASNDADINIKFEAISKMIETITQAWIVTDPMGEYMKKDAQIAKEHQDHFGDRIKIEDGVLQLDLKGLKPNKGTEEIYNNTYNIYELKYTVTVDNQKAGFTPDTYYAANGKTTVTYANIVNGNIQGKQQTAEFKVPKVKGIPAATSSATVKYYTVAKGGIVNGALIDTATPTYLENNDANIDKATLNASYQETVKDQLNAAKPAEGYLDGILLEADKTKTIGEDSATNVINVYYEAQEAEKTQSLQIEYFYQTTSDQEPIKLNTNLIAGYKDYTETRTGDSILSGDKTYNQFVAELNQTANNLTDAYLTDLNESMSTATFSNGVVINPDSKLTIEATNTIQVVYKKTPDQTADFSFRKVSSEEADKDGNNFYPLEGGQFQLLDGQNTKVAEATAVNGIVTFSGLKPGSYGLHETAAPTGYETPTATDTGYTVVVAKDSKTQKFMSYALKGNHRYDGDTNSQNPVVLQNTAIMGDIPVEKIWDDINDLNHRPGEITVGLYNGEEKLQDLTLNQENNWSGKFTNLRLFNKDGKKANYTVKEIIADEAAKAWYNTTVSPKPEGGFTITNSLKSTIALTLEKTLKGEGAPTELTDYQFEITFDQYYTVDDLGDGVKNGDKTTYTLTLPASKTQSGSKSILVRQGVNYEIKEITTEADKFTAQYDGAEKGEIKNAKVKVNVVNHYGNDGLTISKIVSGNTAPANADYKFSARFWSVDEDIENSFATKKAQKALDKATSGLETAKALLSTEQQDLLSQLQADKKAAAEASQTASQALADAQKALEDSKANLESAKNINNQIESSKAAIENLQNTLDALDPTAEDYQQQAADLGKQIADLNEQLDALNAPTEEELQALEQTITDCEKAVEEATNEADLKAKELATAQEKLTNGGDNKDEAIANVVKLTSDVETAQADLEKAKTEKVSMLDQLLGLATNGITSLKSFISGLFIDDEAGPQVGSVLTPDQISIVADNGQAVDYNQETGAFTFALKDKEDAICNFKEFFINNPDAEIYFEVTETDAQGATTTISATMNQEDYKTLDKTIVARTNYDSQQPVVSFTNSFGDYISVKLSTTHKYENGKIIQQSLDQEKAYNTEITQSPLKGYTLVSSNITQDSGLNMSNAGEVTGKIQKDAEIVYIYKNPSSGGGGGGGSTTDPTDPGTTTPPEVILPEEELPAGQLPDQEIPGGVLPEENQDLNIKEEKIPGGALPNTGGMGVELFYGLGAALAGLGVFLRRKDK